MSDSDDRPLVKLDDVLSLLQHLKDNTCIKFLIEECPELTAVAEKANDFRDSHYDHKLNFILNHVPAMIGQWDKNLINIYSNKHYSEYFAQGPSSLVGSHIKDLLGAELYEKNLPFMEFALKGELQTFERDIPTPSGKLKKTLATYIPYRLQDSVEGFVVTVTDVSEIKEKAEVTENDKIFYSHILNSFHEGFVVHGADSKIIYFNDSATKILGLTKDQLLGKSSFDPSWRAIHIDGSDFSGKDHPAMQTIRTGKACFDVIMGITTSNEETKWIKINSIPFHVEYEGQTASVLVTFTDVTHSLMNEKMLSGLIHNSPGMIYKFRITKDGKMSFPFISSKAFDLYEISKEELLQDPDFLLNAIHDDDKESQIAATIISSNDLSDFEWTGRIISKSGKIKWIRVKSTPHLEHDGSIVFEGVVIDVTAEVNLQNELNSERIKSNQSSKLASLGELSAGVAHEINNPLMIISGVSKMLNYSLDDPEKLKYKIIQIEKSVERIAKIVHGLKRFSRMDATSEKKIVNIQKILDDALTLIFIKAKQSDIDLQVDCQSSSNIMCNSIEIEQVLINLANNAADALQGAADKWIRVEVKDNGDQLVIKFTDSGEGVNAAILEKIFDPFFTTKSVGEGTGLGLSISRGIIQDHGGDLSYITESRNTCFVITLPIV